ncbi:MAG: RING finger protein [Oscillospiraceae bacterium]
MPMYFGQECPVCKNKFVSGDDIVVCPQCGTPHHRECYKATGKCANHANHSQSFVWQESSTPKPLPPHIPMQKKCPSCDAECLSDATACPNCGFVFDKSPDLTLYSGEKPVEQTQTKSAEAFSDMDGVDSKDIAVFVRKNPMYYMNVFQYISNKAPMPMINWSAFFFNFFYFFYRKMYKYGFIFLAVIFLSLAPSFVLFYNIWPQYQAAFPDFAAGAQEILAFVPNFTGMDTIIALQNIGQYVIMITSVIAGFMANKLYYKHCIAKINQIRQNFWQKESGLLRYRQELVRRGGTSVLSLYLLMVGMILAFNVVLMLLVATLAL